MIPRSEKYKGLLRKNCLLVDLKASTSFCNIACTNF
jgi:hypothetical protein